jgi:hypothetical protein
VVEVAVVLVVLDPLELLEQELQVYRVDLVVEEDVEIVLVVLQDLEILHQQPHHKEIMDLLVILVDLELVVEEEVLGE